MIRWPLTRLFFIVLSCFFSSLGQGALQIGGWTPDTYETLFSNPVCPEQIFVSYRSLSAPAYRVSKLSGESAWVYPSRSEVPFIKVSEEGIPTLSGGVRKSIPANIFCDAEDFERSTRSLAKNIYRTKDSPYNRLQEWIRSTREGDSLFVASFSLSMDAVAQSICEAKGRGATVKVFIHQLAKHNNAYTRLKTCLGTQLIEFPEGKGRLAHMKSIIIEYKNPNHDEHLKDKVRVSFQSGNISSGTWGHHENWNFITQMANHWFSQDHLCLRDAISHETLANMSLFYAALDHCRRVKGIDALRHDDALVRSYFIPKSGGTYDDRKELKKIIQEVNISKSVWIAAHHLTEKDLLEALKQRLKQRDKDGFSVKILTDSELFWASASIPFEAILEGAVNTKFDSRIYPSPASLTNYCKWGDTEKDSKQVRCSLFAFGDFFKGPGSLVKAGAELKLVESNHLAKMLFHNKIIIFEYAEPGDDRLGSVFLGAGNLSSSGFEKNLENYYLVSIPHVYADFRQQFTELFHRASYPKDLPITWDYKTRDGKLLPLR